MIPCVRCKSDNTDIHREWDYRGSSKLRQILKIDCNECEESRKYTTTYNYVRD